MAKGNSKVLAKGKTTAKKTAKKAAPQRAKAVKTTAKKVAIQRATVAKATPSRVTTTSKKKIAKKSTIAKKVVSKTVAKKKVSASKVVSVELLHKSLTQIREQLAKQFDKEIGLGQKQQQQVKQQLDKAKNKLIIAQGKHGALQQKLEQKTSKELKLKTNKAKQIVDAAQRDVVQIEKKLSTVDAQLNPLLDKHAKFTALQQAITKVESEWGKKPAAKSAVAKSNAISKTKTKASKPLTVVEVHSATPVSKPMIDNAPEALEHFVETEADWS